jgi:hypothetical protein
VACQGALAYCDQIKYSVKDMGRVSGYLKPTPEVASSAIAGHLDH